MRLALLASPVLLVAALAGCSNSSSPDATGAVALELTTPPGGAGCPDDGPESVPPPPNPPVTETAHTSLLTGGSLIGATPCYVAGSASAGYSAYAELSENESDVSVTISNVLPTATLEAGGTGSMSVASPSATQGFGGECSFYFASSGSEKVAPGMIWVDFTCASVSDGSGDSCGVTNGVLYLDNCNTSSD